MPSSFRPRHPTWSSYWQMDYLAPIYLALGCRVVVIPMYDGSSTLPDVHWLWSKQARFVNFSRRLHWNIERCGAQSMLVRYFPKPRRGMEKRSFERLNVLLWQRRPEHGINLHLAENLLGSQMSRRCTYMTARMTRRFRPRAI